MKNLLLHLQVLYVVKNRADVAEVSEGLRQALERIDGRISLLRRIAVSEPIRLERRIERVGQWIAAAGKVAREMNSDIVFDVPSEIMMMEYMAVPEEMEDAFAELARNAFQHGARHVTVAAMKESHCLMITIADDGKGMTDAKLAQLRSVIATRRYDPALTTRSDGTGNGILSAAKAIGRFIDGVMMIDSPRGGKGAVFQFCLKLPSAVKAVHA